MVDIFNVFKKCTLCKGTGKLPVYEGQYNEDQTPVLVDCNVCEGSGEKLWGQIRELPE